MPEAYIYKVHLHCRGPMSRVKKLLWWIPAVVLSVYTIALCCIPDFAPSDQLWLNLFLLLFGLFAAPKFVFMLCSLIGLGVKRGFGLHRNYGTLMGISLSVVIVVAVLYGSFFGVRRLEVKHVEIEFSDLPEAFDGYRIVHISDLHVGSIPHDLLERAVDSINAAHADAVMMTGDIQNMQPSELLPFASLLSKSRPKMGCLPCAAITIIAYMCLAQTVLRPPMNSSSFLLNARSDGNCCSTTTAFYVEATTLSLWLVRRTSGDRRSR